MSPEGSMFDMFPKRVDVGCAIVGGGPAGTGPLVYAGWAGRLDDFVAEGIALIEESGELCSGAIPSFDILSNSPADRFLEALEHPGSQAAFPRACSSSLRAEFHAIRTQHVPLPRAGQLLRELGTDLRSWFERSAGAHLLDRCRAEVIREAADGRYEIEVVRSDGSRNVACIVRAKKILIATGGVPVVDRELGAAIARLCEEAGSNPTFATSHQVLNRTFPVTALLPKAGQRVLIVGGSHSAFSVASLLLDNSPANYFGSRQIIVAHRSRIKLYYDSAAHARSDGYHEYGPEDVCPQTQRIYRVAGLRGAARELYRRVSAAPGCEPEQRVQLTPIRDGVDPGNWPIEWECVGSVVFASGYKLRELPILDRAGVEVPMLGSFTGRYVDTSCRLLRVDGAPFPNIFAMGAATGYLPQQEFGGEKSFAGRDNSVWLCQHGLGQRLVDCLSPGAQIQPSISTDFSESKVDN